MPDFSRSKVGDPAWTRYFGDGEIIYTDGKYIKIQKNGEKETVTVLMDGKVYETDVMPTAWHSKPEFTDPLPIKRKVKKEIKGYILLNPSYYSKPLIYTEKWDWYKNFDVRPCTIIYEDEE